MGERGEKKRNERASERTPVNRFLFLFLLYSFSDLSIQISRSLLFSWTNDVEERERRSNKNSLNKTNSSVRNRRPRISDLESKRSTSVQSKRDERRQREREREKDNGSSYFIDSSHRISFSRCPVTPLRFSSIGRLTEDFLQTCR